MQRDIQHKIKIWVSQLQPILARSISDRQGALIQGQKAKEMLDGKGKKSFMWCHNDTG